MKVRFYRRRLTNNLSSLWWSELHLGGVFVGRHVGGWYIGVSFLHSRYLLSIERGISLPDGLPPEE